MVTPFVALSELGASAASYRISARWASHQSALGATARDSLRVPPALSGIYGPLSTPPPSQLIPRATRADRASLIPSPDYNSVISKECLGSDFHSSLNQPIPQAIELGRVSFAPFHDY
jgi:hypothetical protein